MSCQVLTSVQVGDRAAASPWRCWLFPRALSPLPLPLTQPTPQAPSIFGRLSLKSPCLHLRQDIIMRGLSSGEGPKHFAELLTQSMRHIVTATGAPEDRPRPSSRPPSSSRRSSTQSQVSTDGAAETASAAASQLVFRWLCGAESGRESVTGGPLFIDAKGCAQADTPRRIASALRSKQPMELQLLARPEERTSDVLLVVVALHFHLVSDGLRSETIYSTSHPHAALLEGVFLRREDALAYARLYSDGKSTPQDAMVARPIVNSRIAVLSSIDPREDFVRAIEEVRGGGGGGRRDGCFMLAANARVG